MSILSSVLARTMETAKKEYGNRSWRRRIDIAKEREQQKRLAKEAAEKRKRKATDGLPIGKPLRKKSKIAVQAQTASNERKAAKKIAESLSEEEVINRLRRLRQPIKFFGETMEQRIKRTRQLEIMEAERTQTASEGRRNEFQELMKAEVEAEIEAALAKSMGQKPATEDLLEKDRLKQQAKLERYDKPRPKSEFEHMEDYILFFWKRINREWEKQLNDRAEAEKLSHEGKKETTRQKQARRDIKPFFKLLKSRNVSKEVVDLVTEVIDALIARDYGLAQEKYLELSIGNAPWPMGVTQVGIHERAGRSKIFSSQIAHILNDEAQRKYIQAMKRFMTFAEITYPAETTEELDRIKHRKAKGQARSLLGDRIQGQN